MEAATNLYPDCNVDVSGIPWYARNLGDGFCAPQLNIPECGFDGGDCDEFNAKYPNCVPLYESKVFGGFYMSWTNFPNDTECDSYLNTEDCDYDGGDCLEFNAKYPNCKVSFPFFVGDVRPCVLMSVVAVFVYNSVSSVFVFFAGIL